MSKIYLYFAISFYCQIYFAGFTRKPFLQYLLENQLLAFISMIFRNFDKIFCLNFGNGTFDSQALFFENNDEV